MTPKPSYDRLHAQASDMLNRIERILDERYIYNDMDVLDAIADLPIHQWVIDTLAWSYVTGCDALEARGPRPVDWRPRSKIACRVVALDTYRLSRGHSAAQ